MSLELTSTVYKGEMPALCLGIDVQCVNEKGEQKIAHIPFFNLKILKEITPSPNLQHHFYRPIFRIIFVR